MLIFNLLFFIIVSIKASSGDKQSIFNICVKRCAQTCYRSPPLPLTLRLTRWTCEDDCKYVCMHTITDQALANSEPVHQYYGKWPFYRLWGMQEPASVLFSILNGYYHYKGLRRYCKRIGSNFPLRPVMVFYGFASINTWVWSTVFHARDLPSTEKVVSFN